MSLRDLVFNIIARDRTGAAIDSVSRKLDKFDKQVGNAMTGLAGAGLGSALSGPILRAGGDVLAVASEFEAAMNKVSGVTGATEEQFEALRDQAKALGAATKFSATEAAQAMEYLAMAGFSVDDTLGALPGTLDLASSAALDLGTSADIVSNILTGYRKDVSELAHVNDVLVKAMTSSNTNLVDLGQAMSYAGPIAASAGVEFEEAAAAIGMLGNAGFQGSRAGTAFSGGLARLLKQTKGVKKEMDAAGLSFTDAQGRLLPLVDIVRQLEPHAEDTAMMLKLFGQEAGPGMAAMVAQGADALEKLTTDLRDSTGEAARVGAINMQGYAGSVDELSSAFEGLQLSAADAGLLEMATDTALGLTGLVNAIAEVNPIVLRFGMGLAAAVAVAGPLIVALGVLSFAAGALSAPVLAVVAGIAALVGALVALWPVTAKVAGLIGDGLTWAIDAVVGAFDLWMNKPVEMAGQFGMFVLSLNPVVVAIRAIGAVFEWLFPSTMASIQNLVSGVKEWLLDKLSGIFDSVKAKIKAVGDAFFDLWDRVVGHSYIPDLVDDIGTEMDRLDGEMVNPAIDANERVGESFRDMAKGAIRDLLDLAGKGDLTMRSFFNSILGVGVRWADQMISQVFDTVADAAANALFGGSGGGGLFGGMFGGMFDGGGDALSSALAAIPGLDTGGDAAIVGGRGGMDRNLVKLRLSEGERVQVTRRGSSSGGSPVNVNISTPNPAAFQASRVQLAGTISRAVSLGQRGA